MPRMARKNTQERARITHRKLMDAGKKVFSSYSYHDMHAGDIAKEAGVSVGTFYVHFRDKEELFIEIADEYLESMKEDMIHTFRKNLPDARNDSLDKLVHTVIRLSLEIHRESAAFQKEIIKMSLGNAEVKRLVDGKDREYRKIVEDYLLEYIPHMDKRKTRELSYILYYMFESVTHRMALHPADVNDKRATAIFADIVTTFLRKEAAES
jgi:AcrR family transcriptional regulator